MSSTSYAISHADCSLYVCMLQHDLRLQGKLEEVVSRMCGSFEFSVACGRRRPLTHLWQLTAIGPLFMDSLTGVVLACCRIVAFKRGVTSRVCSFLATVRPSHM
jgi:hypothetical protein